MSKGTRAGNTERLVNVSVRPTQHGAFRGIKRSKGRPTFTTNILRPGQPTLAERFAEAGWRCGAFINNAQLGEFTGLDRGFATYVPTAGKADRLIGIFLEWLEADLDRPIFAYLHFLEAHWPYKPRRRHVAMFGGNRDTNHFREYSARDYGKFRRAISRKEVTLTDDHLEQMIQMYDGAVRRLDGKLKIILAMLAEFGLRDQTAVIVTADHGEEFMEHGLIGHGQSLYNELTHVPLVASIPGMPGDERRSDPVSLVDLPYTLLRIAGIDVEPPGRNLLHCGDTDKQVFAELSTRRRYIQTIHTPDWKLHRRYIFDPVPKEEEKATPWEQVLGVPHRTKFELYDMNSDPREQNNLAKRTRYAPVRRDLAEKLDPVVSKTATAGSSQSAPLEKER